MRATSTCKHCGKISEVLSESTIPALKRIRLTLKCGHTYFEALQAIPSGRDSKWADFFPYQQEGIKFVENANFKCLVADEMGLGKTIQALGTIRYNPNILPAVCFCKSSLIFNWIREYMTWVKDGNDDPLMFPIPVMDGQVKPLSGYKFYLVSMDLIYKPKIMEWIQETPFKTLLIDESHHFKNVNSKRTGALNTVTKHIPNRICLSGTPILNNALEYWPTLNLIRPEHFPSRSRFAQRYMDYDHKTKRYLGIHKYARTDFFNTTSKYVIRREKKDVLKDLPPLRSNSQVLSSFDRGFATAYNKLIDELEKKLAAIKGDFMMKASFMDILSLLSKMRHITGLAKVVPTAEYVQEFLESTPESAKICIGIHHKDVALWLAQLFAKYNPITISGADSPEAKDQKEQQFKKLENRIAICNILAVGEGRNFQFCQNAIVVERQWNRMKEAQFEGRFQRPIKCAECNAPFRKVTPTEGEAYYQCPKCGHTEPIVSIQIDYLLAARTIDEFFDKMVRMKGMVCDSTLSWDFETDYQAIYTLAAEVVQARMRATV